MKILLISNREQREFEGQIRARGSSIFQSSPSLALALLARFPAEFAADVILLDILVESETVSPPDTLAVIELAGTIRKLPDWCAMADGRKWARVPIIWKTRGADFAAPKAVIHGRQDEDFVEMNFAADITLPFRATRSIVWNYYMRLANDYDNIGYIVTEDHGRLRASEAFRARARSNTRYYYGPADRRRAKIFTLARDFEGDANTLSEFMDLIDPRMRSTEHAIQRFLGDASDYLTVEAVDVISHPRIGKGAGRSELDFVFRPYIDRAASASWSLYEIKRADQPVMAGLNGEDPKLTKAIFRAVSQVRRYKRLIDDPQSRDKVLKALGGLPQDAKLAVLVGRRPLAHRDSFDSQLKSLYPDVSIVTYDDLFEARERALSIS